MTFIVKFGRRRLEVFLCWSSRRGNLYTQKVANEQLGSKVKSSLSAFEDLAGIGWCILELGASSRPWDPLEYIRIKQNLVCFKRRVPC